MCITPGFSFKSFILLTAWILTNSSIFASDISKAQVFRDISLTTAKETAAKEGKMILVDFYASWCTPCRWMDQTTFTDQAVIDYIDQNFVAVRVDIDDFDGYVLRNVFNVKVLPTILILDENGMTKQRKEETLSPQALLDMMKNKNPKDQIAKVNSSPFKNKTEQEVVKIDFEILPEKNSNPGNHATVEPTMTYRVQVGVFADYANTQKMVDQMSDLAGEPIVVLNDNLNGKTIFKVMLGAFENRESANIFKNQLQKNYGIEGIVK